MTTLVTRGFAVATNRVTRSSYFLLTTFDTGTRGPFVEGRIDRNGSREEGSKSMERRRIVSVMMTKINPNWSALTFLSCRSSDPHQFDGDRPSPGLVISHHVVRRLGVTFGGSRDPVRDP